MRWEKAGLGCLLFIEKRCDQPVGDQSRLGRIPALDLDGDDKGFRIARYGDGVAQLFQGARLTRRPEPVPPCRRNEIADDADAIGDTARAGGDPAKFGITIETEINGDLFQDGARPQHFELAIDQRQDRLGCQAFLGQIGIRQPDFARIDLELALGNVDAGGRHGQEHTADGTHSRQDQDHLSKLPDGRHDRGDIDQRPVLRLSIIGVRRCGRCRNGCFGQRWCGQR